MLPSTTETLFSVLEQYNRAIWPAHVLAYGLGLAAVVLALRPVAVGGTEASTTRKFLVPQTLNLLSRTAR